MAKRAFLEGFFTASTVAVGGHFMWQRINQQSPLLASAPVVNPRNDTLAASEKLDSFQFTPIEIKSVQPSEGIPLPAPVITPEKKTEHPLRGRRTRRRTGRKLSP